MEQVSLHEETQRAPSIVSVRHAHMQGEDAIHKPRSSWTSRPQTCEQ